ncbi:c-type cytochrome [Pseudohalocynthiibacter aestuariivivens]|jgi:mono/diheme cytochrome c family protein|uniref:C-type cytochrome n=1 Tax=Pseudohalocynthiibacter aestuariivivens TaxID=1591409 RepID=A0ABV5JJ37_9RHOB|nr:MULTISPECIES: cytochrome c [Pseudohalocynthiibacter]MBS9717434.1 cytochrome c [Pseudohalocynthiibacter aestuariivivens]MCK0102232.1 cytochrome c [Pseudohalocynthiibacter sp. F2068]
MNVRPIATAFLIASGMALAGSAGADEGGMNEYMQSCSGCHGPNALGDGEMAEFMTIKVPDLTMLKQGNDGVFPMLRVIHSIDGRTGVRGHGTEMPIWGLQYKDAVMEDAGVYGAETIIRGRVLSIAYYLESIQQ